jgi:hypothetical protein
LASSSDAFPDDLVRFRVEIRNGEFVPEPAATDIVLPTDQYRRIRGQVEIATGGPESVAPEDELVPLVTNLCFRAVVQLVEHRHAVVAYTDSYGYLRLDLEGDRIRLSAS